MGRTAFSTQSNSPQRRLHHLTFHQLTMRFATFVFAALATLTVAEAMSVNGQRGTTDIENESSTLQSLELEISTLSDELDKIVSGVTGRDHVENKNEGRDVTEGMNLAQRDDMKATLGQLNAAATKTIALLGLPGALGGIPGLMPSPSPGPAATPSLSTVLSSLLEVLKRVLNELLTGNPISGRSLRSLRSIGHA
ncbi:hypothetical protein B0H12DRAFT_1225931 [Mycena haematopus]|nr:hypothetical protein B0H12DRAFT_1225931 [Mycena haematopus]